MSVYQKVDLQLPVDSSMLPLLTDSVNLYSVLAALLKQLPVMSRLPRLCRRLGGVAT